MFGRKEALQEGVKAIKTKPSAPAEKNNKISDHAH